MTTQANYGWLEGLFRKVYGDDNWQEAAAHGMSGREFTMGSFEQDVPQHRAAPAPNALDELLALTKLGRPGQRRNLPSPQTVQDMIGYSLLEGPAQPAQGLMGGNIDNSILNSIGDNYTSSGDALEAIIRRLAGGSR